MRRGRRPPRRARPGGHGLAYAFVAVAAAVVFGGVAPAAPARASDLALGMQDDATLALWPQDPVGLLDLAHRHGVSAVRFIIRPAQDDERFGVAAELAVAAGMRVEVTLSNGGLAPEPYRRWAGATARHLREHGARTFSVLNEPDLTLPSSDQCTAESAPEVLRQEGLTVGRRAVHRRVVARYRRVRRWSRRPPRRRIVVRVRIRAARRRVAPVVLTGDEVWATGITNAAAAPEGVAICRRIIRARSAAEYYRAVVPALRAAVPDAQIWIGETSPSYGVQQFIEELLEQPLPAVDGFAHHPYPRWDGQPSTEDGSLWLDHLQRVPALLGGLPLYLTEFGVMSSATKRQIVDAEGAAAIWRTAIAAACRAGARQLVAYQWDPNPPGSDPWGWDTSILGRGRTTTPSLGALSAAAGCSRED